MLFFLKNHYIKYLCINSHYWNNILLFVSQEIQTIPVVERFNLILLGVHIIKFNKYFIIWTELKFFWKFYMPTSKSVNLQWYCSTRKQKKKNSSKGFLLPKNTSMSPHKIMKWFNEAIVLLSQWNHSWCNTHFFLVPAIYVKFRIKKWRLSINFNGLSMCLTAFLNQCLLKSIFRNKLETSLPVSELVLWLVDLLTCNWNLYYNFVIT